MSQFVSIFRYATLTLFMASALSVKYLKCPMKECFEGVGVSWSAAVKAQDSFHLWIISTTFFISGLTSITGTLALRTNEIRGYCRLFWTIVVAVSLFYTLISAILITMGGHLPGVI